MNHSAYCLHRMPAPPLTEKLQPQQTVSLPQISYSVFCFSFVTPFSSLFSHTPFFTVNVKNCRRKYPVGRIFIQLSPLFSTISHCTKVSIDRFPKVCKDNERKNHILPPKGRIFTDNKTPPESGRYFAGNPGEIVDQDKSNQLRTDRRSFRSRLRRYAPLPELSAGQASS